MVDVFSLCLGMFLAVSTEVIVRRFGQRPTHQEEPPEAWKRPLFVRPAPPIEPNPALDAVTERGGPSLVPLPEWLKRLG